MTTATIDTKRTDEVQRNVARVRELIGKGVTGKRLEAAEDALEQAEGRQAQAAKREARRSSLLTDLARDQERAELAQRLKRARDAETAYRTKHAPVVVLSYGALTITVLLDKAGVDPRFARHAVETSVRIVREHFDRGVGLARAQAQGMEAPRPKSWTQIADYLKDQLRVALRHGVFAVTIK